MTILTALRMTSGCPPPVATDPDAGSSNRSDWLPILLYHRVVPVVPRRDPYHNCVSSTAFASHMAWLAQRGYQTLSLDDVGKWLEQRREDSPSLPRRPMAITFDDGYQDTYRYAWPVLERYGFTASVFVVTDAIGGDNSFDIGPRSGGVPMLTGEEIRELHRYRVDIGSHTCSHPASLVDLADDRLVDELARSRATLEDVVGAPAEHFAYPHSKVDRRVEAAVRDAGYTLACAGVGRRFSRFCLQRVAPPAGGGARTELQIHWRRLKRLAGRWIDRAT
jgi:peptidoglycan/xylan/chitin deacetylase (PgdA/CDA1 family)